jgi:hypothetical protein
MSDNPDYILDLSSQTTGQQQDDIEAEAVGQLPAGAMPSEGSESADSGRSRKWIGVHFKCCDVYTRIWRNREGTAYAGTCPRCHRKIQARIGPDGVSARFFEAL